MKSTQKKKGVGRNLTRAFEVRVAYIHEQIYHERYPTQQSLANDLEVSTDCIDDDIRAMRTYRKLPIEFSRVPGKVGYYYSGPVPEKLGAVTITEEQLLNLILAEVSMSQVPVKQKNKRLDLGLDGISKLIDPRTRKLIKELRGAVYFRPFAPEEIDLVVLMTLTEAIRRRRVLKVFYTKHRATTGEWKRLYPYCFTCAANAWYVIAFDPDANQFKTYMLSRMKEPELLEEKFERQPFDLTEYLAGAFIIMKGSGKEWFDVVVDFDSWAAPYIRNRQFTKYQKFDELPDGGLRISMKLTCLEEVEAWVCYWREHAYVVGPTPFREKLFAYGQYLVKAYGPKGRDECRVTDGEKG